MTSESIESGCRAQVCAASVRDGSAAFTDIYVVIEPETSSEPTFTIRGDDGSMLDAGCSQRVRDALQTNNQLPQGQVTVTVSIVAPQVPREFDLPIAIGVLVAQGALSQRDIAEVIMTGTFSESDNLGSVPGVLPIALACARREPRPVLLVPMANLAQAWVLGRVHADGIYTLKEAVFHLSGPSYAPSTTRRCVDLAAMEVDPVTQRALEIAAAGGHHTLLIGPTGARQMMLGDALMDFLPPFSKKEAVETTALHSLAGVMPYGDGLLSERPGRAPHPTASRAVLFGGGDDFPRPGEVSLAHHGVLYLDNLPAFERRAIEGIGAVLANGDVRAVYRNPVVFPADALCMATVHRCPCGLGGGALAPCRCTAQEVERYFARVFFVLKHFDLTIGVASLPPLEETRRATTARPSTTEVRARVVAARHRQRAYWPDGKAGRNARLSMGTLEQFCARGALSTLDQRKENSEKRIRLLRVARTIADLDGSDTIEGDHVMSAADYHIGKMWSF